MKYETATNSPIEKFKNRLADRTISFIDFHKENISQTGMTYWEFLICMNYDRSFPDNISPVIENFIND